MTALGSKARVRRLAGALTDFDSQDPLAIRREALRVLRLASDADFTTFYNVSELEGRMCARDVQVHGDGRNAEAVMRSAPDFVVRFVDYAAPPPEVLTGFFSVHWYTPVEEFRKSALYEHVWLPTGVQESAGLMVFHGRANLGTVGACWRRASRFSLRERDRLSPLVPVLRAAVTAAHSLLHIGLPTEPAYLLVRAEGGIDHASRSAKEWLRRPGIVRAVRKRVADLERRSEPEDLAALDYAEARFVRLQTGGGPRYLVCLRPATDVRRPANALLTQTQARIAAAAAAGATLEEISHEVGRSVGTVRDHLRAVYRKLRVRSRLELARGLAD